MRIKKDFNTENHTTNQETEKRQNLFENMPLKILLKKKNPGGILTSILDYLKYVHSSVNGSGLR